MFNESLPTVREAEKGLERDDASVRLGLVPGDFEIRRFRLFPSHPHPQGVADRFHP
jgi:hypothetical protein